MTSRDPEKSSHDRNIFGARYLDNGWIYGRSVQTVYTGWA